MNGIINIYKEKGYTSFDVVAILRRKLHIKKVGHTGTLDPEAEGVLPICIGKATKVADYITDTKKIYRTTMTLGVTTDTEDHTGQVLETREVCVTQEEIRKAISSFIGEIEQVPPMYSALKVNGTRLYQLARQGKTVERKARKITVYNMIIHGINGNDVDMSIECSKGTYIRTICADIGEKLGCGAHMSKLLRIKSSMFTLEHSLKIDEIDHYIEEDKLEEIVMPVDQVFTYDKLTIDSEFEKLLYNGNKLGEECVKDHVKLNTLTTYRVYDERKTFIGIYEAKEAAEELILKPIKVFL